MNHKQVRVTCLRNRDALVADVPSKTANLNQPSLEMVRQTFVRLAANIPATYATGPVDYGLLFDASLGGGTLPRAGAGFRKILISASAFLVLSAGDVHAALELHATVAFGATGRCDDAVMTYCLPRGEAVVTDHRGARGAGFAIMTAGDQSLTAIGLPDEFRR